MAQTRLPSNASRHDAGHGSPAVIAAGTRVRGRVHGTGDLTVRGDVEGELHLRGELVIAEGGRVVSDVDADALRVSGELEGNVRVAGDVSILAGAKVRGDVQGASVSLEEGADLDGRLDSEFTLPRELLTGAGSGEDGPRARR
jgi:cytoskeletal protein CcmA (bactofilin family)